MQRNNSKFHKIPLRDKKGIHTDDRDKFFKHMKFDAITRFYIINNSAENFVRQGHKIDNKYFYCTQEP
jgi:hypothetical protein